MEVAVDLEVPFHRDLRNGRVSVQEVGEVLEAKEVEECAALHGLAERDPRVAVLVDRLNDVLVVPLADTPLADTPLDDVSGQLTEQVEDAERFVRRLLLLA
jgi:hypothetical protein